MSYIVNFLETITQLLFNNIAAPMAELADALDLGSSSERSTGSIPARCTKMIEIVPDFWTLNEVNPLYWTSSIKL